MSTVTFYVIHFQLMTNDFPIARPQTKTVKCIPLLSYFRGVGKFWQCYGNKKVQLSQFGCRPSANSLIDCLQLAGLLLPHHQRNSGGRILSRKIFSVGRYMSIKAICKIVIDYLWDSGRIGAFICIDNVVSI